MNEASRPIRIAEILGDDFVGMRWTVDRVLHLLNYDPVVEAESCLEGGQS